MRELLQAWGLAKRCLRVPGPTNSWLAVLNKALVSLLPAALCGTAPPPHARIAASIIVRPLDDDAHSWPQVFVTAQARTLDLATCLVQGSGVLLLVSPGMKQDILQRLDKYIFPGDKVSGWAG